MKLHGWIFLGLLVAAAGCANQPGSASTQSPTTLPTSRPSDPKAFLAVSEIEPRVSLPEARPATQPAPLDAVVLFARARNELIQNRRYTAINLLEGALRLDPDSFELNHALGRAYAGAGGMNERALTAFERAATINPNDLEIQTELGRAYQSRNNNEKAIKRLRLAQLTTGYKDGDALASVVDYRLGYLLQQQGYTTAALECYTRLQTRLEHPDGAARGSPEVVYLLSRPELVYEEVGRLHEELGNLSEAMKAYERVAQETPDDFDAHARVVRTMVRLGRGRDASAAAAELVRTSRASIESIALLREIHEKTGARGSFIDELRRLSREQPNDRALLFALADTLAGAGQLEQAAEILNRDIEAHPGEIEIVQRLYRLYADRDQVPEAARVVLRAMISQPHATQELIPLLDDLTRSSRKNALRLMTISRLEVPPAVNPAKQYFIAYIASKWDRASLSRHALAEAAKANPPFDPAIRLLIADVLTRPDYDDEARQREAGNLIQSVRARGREDLAQELSGRVAMRSQQFDQATAHFEQAVRQAPGGKPAPELQIEYAQAIRLQGNVPRFEQMLWRLVSDRPRTTAAYVILLDHYKRANADSQAWNVRNTWIAADPQNVLARLQLIDGLLELRRGDEAIAQMRRLFDDRPDDRDVVREMIGLFRLAELTTQLIELLEAERFRHPNNRVVVEALVVLYDSQNRAADANRVLDAARQAVANDPDLLYYVANLYHTVDQPQMTETILQEVLKVDPAHAPAGNDLGYTWADAGKNLEQAEPLIRMAVNAEPDNPSYLDSLGWVLYKRSKFDEAVRMLHQASEPKDSADPVVLDHLGDAQYRMGQWGEAQQTWQHALQRIGAEPARQQMPLYQTLQMTLQNKLRQAGAGEPVTVAPIVETSPNNSQQTSSSGQNNGRP